MSEPEKAQPVNTTVPSSRDQYIWAIVVVTLVGMLIIVSVVALRPEMDALVIIGGVMAGLAPTTAAIMAYIKAQETHLSVNSRLDAFIKQHEKAAFADGKAQGIENGGRIAKDTREKIPEKPVTDNAIAIETIKEGIETIEDGTDHAKSGLEGEGK